MCVFQVFCFFFVFRVILYGNCLISFTLCYFIQLFIYKFYIECSKALLTKSTDNAFSPCQHLIFMLLFRSMSNPFSQTTL